MSQHYDEFIKDAKLNGCNIEFAHAYMVSDMTSNELIIWSLNKMPQEDIIVSLGYLFRYTIEAAQIIVAGVIKELLETDMGNNHNTITIS